jgi:uncharacterized protein YidB (DUF937 family)
LRQGEQQRRSGDDDECSQDHQPLNAIAKATRPSIRPSLFALSSLRPNQPIFEQETDMGLLDILNGLQNRPDVAPALGSGSGGMSPLMKALLGMIAFKAIRSLTGSNQSSGAGGGAAASAGGGLGDLLGGLGSLLGGGAAGGTLVGGLSDLLNQFEQSGKGEVAQSWIGSGPNKAISSADLANTLGAD